MSLWRRRVASLTALPQFNTRPVTRSGGVYVSTDTALRTSAVWACLRLRADLISSFPVDVFRTVDGHGVVVF